MAEGKDLGQLAVLHGLVPEGCIEQVTVVKVEDGRSARRLAWLAT